MTQNSESVGFSWDPTDLRVILGRLPPRAAGAHFVSCREQDPTRHSHHSGRVDTPYRSTWLQSVVGHHVGKVVLRVSVVGPTPLSCCSVHPISTLFTESTAVVERSATSRPGTGTTSQTRVSAIELSAQRLAKDPERRSPTPSNQTSRVIRPHLLCHWTVGPDRVSPLPYPYRPGSSEWYALMSRIDLDRR